MNAQPNPRSPAGNAEPVAWSYERWCGGDGWQKILTRDKPAGEKWERNIVALYAVPQVSSQPATPAGDVVAWRWRHSSSRQWTYGDEKPEGPSIHLFEVEALAHANPILDVSSQPATPAGNADTFQKRVLAWLMECFSMEVCRDGTERNHRFLEESLELVQSLGCTRSEAHQLVDYVFDRPTGEPMQELGGVQVTLAALCFPHDLDMHQAAETELARVWTKIEKIRAKQAAKPKHSPLPAHVPSQPETATHVELTDILLDHLKIKPTGRIVGIQDAISALLSKFNITRKA